MNIKINDVYNISIIDQESQGLGISKIKDFVIFIENGLPGDEGKVLITEIKKNYAKGKMISFSRVSQQRINSLCPYFNECGGCDLQHQNYKYQLDFKKNKVKKALERIGNLKHIHINDVIYGKDFYYRNKITLKVEGNKIGFYKRNSNDIIDINKCLISHPKINDCIDIIQSFIKKHPNNKIKEIMIRYSDGIMINITEGEKSIIDKLISLLSDINTVISINLNNKLIFGNSFINEKIGKLTFKLSVTSFYQVNKEIMNKLYSKVIEYISDNKLNTVLDLYCGVGTISLLISKYAAEVIGIELNKIAINNAKDNAILNKINNVKFYHGKVEHLLPKIVYKKVDAIIVDPPRNGIDKHAIRSLIKLNPSKIIYISCNPATLARDLKILCSSNYHIADITPFDMFPQTNHVETIALLERN